VSSFLGEKEKHLQQILNYCEHGARVLLFDEIDMLAAKQLS
jgi:hypothetical protein